MATLPYLVLSNVINYQYLIGKNSWQKYAKISHILPTFAEFGRGKILIS